MKNIRHISDVNKVRCFYGAMTHNESTVQKLRKAVLKQNLSYMGHVSCKQTVSPI